MSQEVVDQMNSAAQVQFDALKKKPDPAKLAELGADFYASVCYYISFLFRPRLQLTPYRSSFDFFGALSFPASSPSSFHVL